MSSPREVFQRSDVKKQFWDSANFKANTFGLSKKILGLGSKYLWRGVAFVGFSVLPFLFVPYCQKDGSATFARFGFISVLSVDLMLFP